MLKIDYVYKRNYFLNNIAECTFSTEHKKACGTQLIGLHSLKMINHEEHLTDQRSFFVNSVVASIAPQLV
jgi:hypothetical protein